ncbi:pyrimidine-specific ribonucleoside hydrolase RihA [Drosophila obscura]|uniref:pyrimidine-specific ribonucleoside hydrolase RihA n=1 Tax=Drosophila obscura TaxID=7282 RepID=UPI001BB0F48C|nr:pyrimidine-specific ribonucleoside hydrolase RihA [Drosophila obscura]
MANACVSDSDSFVVYDCDIGTDDAWGLAMLLRAEGLPIAGRKSFRVTAVTCVQGNTSVENGTLNAFRVLSTLERLDVPVFKGCADPIVPRTWALKSQFHGVDGLGDVGDYPAVNADDLLSEEHAVNAMYRLACQHPGKVDFLLCGPLTNFACCINLYGDAFLDKLGGVYIMGGNILGKGNVTKSAEFNFMMDQEAAHIVLERLKRPALILPWEPCIDGELGMTLDWRLNVLGAVKHPFVELLTRVERSMLVPRGFQKWVSCDALLTAAYLFPQQMIADEREYYATVELCGVHTRGQMVLDHLRGRWVDAIHGKTKNVRVIRRLNAEPFRTIISYTAFLPQAEIDMERLCKEEEQQQQQS